MISTGVKYIIVGILSILGFVVYPMIQQAERLDDATSRIVEQATIEFVDTVRSKGYVDNRDYKIFRERLDSTGSSFEVQLEHYKKRYEPLYDDPNDFYTFSEKFETLYDGYFTRDILDQLFPPNNLPEDDPSRRYNMRVGDLFNVRVQSLGYTLSSRVRAFIGQSIPMPIVYTYGGMVRNESP